MTKFIFACFFLLLAGGSRAEIVATGLWQEDLKGSFKLLFQGALEQFQTPSNLAYAVPASGALWYTFSHDDRLSDLARSKKMNGAVKTVGDMGVFFNMPLTPVAVYALGRHYESTHVMQFMMETAATLYLSLGESGLLSFIPIHERPVTSENNFWEKAFRGKSSFPSGHMIPYAAFAFKTLQFYGPWWSLPPFLLTAMASLQRVQDGKHYVSDVVGSFFLTAFASEGVRQAAGYKNNHPFYRWIVERDVQVGVVRSRSGTLGPALTWHF